MKKYLSLKKSCIICFIGMMIFSVWVGCRPAAPTLNIIEKAKVETMSILDSLKRDDNNIIISDVDISSQYFDGDVGKYFITYEVESGLDSAHIATSEAIVSLEKKDDSWNYRFVFGDTFERILENN
jgi:hypothetical protein